MATHQELLRLSQDIEVLKNAGCIKAASILHKKFIKESQAVQTQDGQMKSQSGGGNPYTQPPGTTYILGPGGTQVVRPEDLVSPYPVQTPPPTPALPPLPPGYNPGDYSFQDPKTGRTIYLDPRTGQPFEGGLSQGYGGNPGTYSSGPGGGGYITVPQPPANTVPPPGTYQNPGGDTQRGYGNQQSQDQELQYLMNEKKRLEEMGASDPNSNLYQQYQTILEMIKRNQGGSAIRKSKNMNKFEKLAKLNKDIEVLENAGKLQAANVLHKKFVKEAQDAFGGLVTQDAKNFMMELDKAYRSGQPTLGVMQKAERAGLPPQEMQILKGHADKLRNQAKNDYDSKYPNTGYQTPNNTTAPSTSSVQDPTAPIGDLSDQVKAEQADIAVRGLGNAIQSVKENMDIPAKYRMTPQENAAENQLYTKTINEIKKLLTGNQQQRNYARGLYESTRSKFKNLQR